MNEHAGATDGGRGIKDVARDQFKLIQGDSELQRFILSRALMTATALYGPLYVALAQRSGGQALDNLGWLLLVRAGRCAQWIVLGYICRPLQPSNNGD